MTFSDLGLHSFPEKSETVTPAGAVPAPAVSESPAPPAESSQNREGNRKLTLSSSLVYYQKGRTYTGTP